MSNNTNESYIENEDTQKGKYLTFELQEESYGIEIRHVTEIIGIQNITKVPELPQFIQGIINLRGKIIPMMDVRLRFKKPLTEYDDRTCIIVVDINNVSLGLIVDTVSEVMVIEDENVVSPPATMMGTGNAYIKGIGKTETDVKLLLDCEKLLRDDEFEQLKTIS